MHVILQTNFNKRSVAVSSRQRGRCQLNTVNKLLIPAAPTLNIGHGSPVRLRKTMVAIGNASLAGVCTENLIRVDEVAELPKLAQ